jgi:glycosyltransferase involved in cell wall biosynthesis
MLTSMPARVAILTPFAFPSVRGNAVTAARVALGLRERGVELGVWDLGTTAPATVETHVEAYRPALIHAFHARRVGPLAARLAHRLHVPLVVTLTGTDANHDLVDPARQAAVRSVLDSAARVTAFHATIVERVAAAVPELRERLVVVPQAVRLPASEALDLGGRWPLPANRILFVFPAGVRAVKNPLFPLAPLGRAMAAVPEIRLAYAGPLLDPDVGDSLLRALATRPWARHIGAVPHPAMASLLSQADVVLNCSISEGGMANSVLEALSLGRAVLASDIEGNRSVVEDGSTGFLFRDEVELEQRATELARDPALRERLGRAGRELVARRYPPEREVEGYRAVYASLVPVLA